MRLGWRTGKYSITYRAVKTVRIDGKNKTLIVKSFGSEKYICETDGGTDAKVWAKEQVRLMNEEEKESSASFNITLCSGTDLVMNEQRAIYARHSFEYDLNAVMSRLIYTRIPFPSSKKNSLEESRRFMEQP